MMKSFFKTIDSSLGIFLEDGAKIMLMIFAVVALLTCLFYQLNAVPHPFSLDYGEAPLVDQAMRLAAGQNIYRTDLSAAPYTISNYPPLYVAVISVFVRLFGPAAAFPAGRLVSALSAWVAALCIYYIISKVTRDRLAAFVGGAALIAFPFVTYWSPLLRIDSFALGLSMTGLALLAIKPVSNRRLILSALFLTGAVFTRQSYALAVPMAAFFWLVGSSWKKAFALAALVGSLSLALFAALNIVTNGGFFYNIVTANVNEFGFERLHWNAQNFYNAAAGLIFLGAFSILLSWRWNPLWSMVFPFIVGAAISASTIGKIGSNVNYLLELCAALSLASGSLIAWSRSRLPSSFLRGMILVLMALSLGQMTRFMLKEKTGDLRDRIARVEDIRKLETIVSETPGAILADEYMGLLTLQGRPLSIQPFEVTQLARAGQWDQTPLLENIKKNEFAAVIIYEPWSSERWTPEMRLAIDQSYILSDDIAGNKVYIPRKGLSSTRVESCPAAAWRLPDAESIGVKWQKGKLSFYGQGNAGKIPVYAAADGMLLRQPDWFDRVALLANDPLHPGGKVWIIYSEMAASNGIDSYVSTNFPPASELTPVKTGQVIGYQGTWRGTPNWSSWVHVTLEVIPARNDTFPAAYGQADLIDPTPYLGLSLQPEDKMNFRQKMTCGAK